MRKLVMTTAVAALVLVIVPSAWAISPPRKSPATGDLNVFVGVGASQQKDRQQSCAKGAPRSRGRVAGSTATANMARKAVVAGEQPPRSQLVPLGLKHVQWSAVTALMG